MAWGEQGHASCICLKHLVQQMGGLLHDADANGSCRMQAAEDGDSEVWLNGRPISPEHEGAPRVDDASAPADGLQAGLC